MIRAHNVIIVSSGAGAESAARLDQLVLEIKKQNRNPILVLGPDGDELLRACTQLEECDLVFDPNFEGDLFSGVKAGLHATNGAAFVVPLTAELLETSKWNDLETTLFTNEETKKVDVVCPQRLTPGAEAPAFPQIVTLQGVRELIKLPSSTSWLAHESISFTSVAL